MAMNLPNFLNSKRTEIPDFLGDAVRGYQAGRMPHAIRQEEERNRIANALQQMELEQKPQMFEQDILGKQLKNQSSQNELNVQPEMLALALRDAQRGTRLGEGYDEQLIRSKLEQAYAAAEAQRAHGDYYKAQSGGLLDSLKEDANPNIPQGATRLDQLSKPEQTAVTKEMRADLRRAEDVYKADKTLDEMKKIIKAHPNLSDSLANILVDPKNTSMLSKITRSSLNQKDRAALEKFTKLSNDLVLQAGTALGAKNFTDAKLKVLETAKPTSLNTREANLFLINKMKEEFAPWRGYADELKNGLKNRYVVEYDLDRYRGMPESDNNAINYEQPKYKVFNNETGQEEYLTEEEAIAEGLLNG